MQKVSIYDKEHDYAVILCTAQTRCDLEFTGKINMYIVGFYNCETGSCIFITIITA
jgi:hypothetical protein